MLVVLGQNRYDVPHSLHAAKKMEELEPDAVCLELPNTPFQKIIDSFMRGKTNKKNFIVGVSDVIGKELNIDHKLIEKFSKGEMTIEELELIEPDASFVHIVMHAKDHTIPVFAVDIPLSSIEKEVRQIMKYSQKHKDRAIKEAMEVMMGVRPVAFMRWAHEPFHILEILIGHHPERDPFKHKTECPICKAGVAWERLAHHVGSTLSHYLPVSKTLVALRHFDLVRERKIADQLVKIHEERKKKLGREPNVFAVLHVWHEGAVENLVKKKGIKVVDVS